MHPDREWELLIEPVRALLVEIGKPYIIENVEEVAERFINKNSNKRKQGLSLGEYITLAVIIGLMNLVVKTQFQSG